MSWCKQAVLEMTQSKSCSEQEQLEQSAQWRAQLDFEYLWEWRLHSHFGHPVPVCEYHHSECVFLCLNGISYISVCAHCLLSSHWATLKRCSLHLRFFLLQILITRRRFPWVFLLQAEQSHLFQPLLLWQILQFLNHLNGSLLLCGIHS